MIRIMELEKTPREEIFARGTQAADVSAPVSEIIDDVRTNGDAALYRYAQRFDGATLSSLEVSADEMEAAVRAVEPRFIAVLQKAARRIRAFHEKQVRSGFQITTAQGSIMGQKITPIESAGLYVPGGTASYPSSVLMNCIPAKIAGVSQVIIATPPTGGEIAPVILAAARIAGADRVFRMGGAQAVAALAYGTESVPRVDKIVGPGNAYVAEAKRQVFGRVAIDMMAGPSEILIIASGDSNPVCVAADMLSQAEHDANATAVLITDSRALAEETARELDRQLRLLPRRQTAAASIEKNGKIIVTKNLEEAIDLSNALAPEHLELMVPEPFRWLEKVKHAGSVFLGENCPEALGDYMAGPNHTLPTGGTARFSSPLSVDDFIKKTQFTCFTSQELREIAEDVMYFAKKEGLEAHGASVAVRLEARL